MIDVMSTSFVVERFAYRVTIALRSGSDAATDQLTFDLTGHAEAEFCKDVRTDYSPQEVRRIEAPISASNAALTSIPLGLLGFSQHAGRDLLIT